MEPLSIRLSEFEMRALADIVAFAYYTCADAPDHKKPLLTSGLIILAEFYPTWKKRCAAVPLKKTKTNPLCRIPISVAQVLHSRLQHSPQTQANQWLLENLDLALVNRSLRPVTPKPIA